MALNLRFGGDFRQMNNWEQIIFFVSQSGIFWRHSNEPRWKRQAASTKSVLDRIRSRNGSRSGSRTGSDHALEHGSKKSERCVSFHQPVIIIIFTISWHELLFLYSMSFSTGERKGGMRSKIVLEMSAEVHVSDFCGPRKWPHGVLGQKNFQWGLRSITSINLF